MPVVAFLDGHVSHLSFETTEFCLDHGIHLISLHPNSTQIIQPMDVSMFSVIKQKWRRAIHEWKFQNHTVNFKSEAFASVLKKLLLENAKPEYFRAGFETCGLYPFNPDRFNYLKIISKPVIQCTHDDEQAKIDQHEYAITLRRIGELIGKEKELEFFKHFTKIATIESTINVRDQSLFEIWKETLIRSKSDYYR